MKKEENINQSSIESEKEKEEQKTTTEEEEVIKRYNKKLSEYSIEDLTPIPQDDGPHPVCPIDYAEDCFQFFFSFFFVKKNQNLFDIMKIKRLWVYSVQFSKNKKSPIVLSQLIMKYLHSFFFFKKKIKFDFFFINKKKMKLKGIIIKCS